jgi:hypothetical protein
VALRLLLLHHRGPSLRPPEEPEPSEPVPDGATAPEPQRPSGRTRGPQEQRVRPEAPGAH